MGATGRLGFAAGLALAASLWCPPPGVAAGAGTSLRFTGIEGGGVDRVKFPVTDGTGDTVLNVGGWDFTVELWVKARAADNTAPAADCTSFRHWSNGNVVVDRDRYGQNRDWGVAVAGGKILAGIATDVMSKSVCGGTSILDDAWHHVVLQYDYESTTPGSLSLYVDGVQDGVATGVEGHADYPPGGEVGDGCGGPCVNDPFIVVGGGKVNGVRSFRGFVDEIRVSNVVRYTENFIRPVGRFASDGSTMGLFHLDEAAGTAIRNASNYPIAGTRTASAAGGPEWWTATPFAAGPGARVGATGSSRPSPTATATRRPATRRVVGAMPPPPQTPVAASIAPSPAASKRAAFFPTSSKTLAGPPPVAIALAGVGIAVAIAVHFLRSDRDGERL